MRNWGYQTFHSQSEFCAAYERTTAAILRVHRDHGVCAAVYTQTTDVEGEVNGLITYDRRVEKLARDVTSQLPVERWHIRLNDLTLADAILDRLVHNAHRVELKGESLRRKKTA